MPLTETQPFQLQIVTQYPHTSLSVGAETIENVGGVIRRSISSGESILIEATHPVLVIQSSLARSRESVLVPPLEQHSSSFSIPAPPFSAALKLDTHLLVVADGSTDQFIVNGHDVTATARVKLVSASSKEYFGMRFTVSSNINRISSKNGHKFGLVEFGSSASNASCSFALSVQCMDRVNVESENAASAKRNLRQSPEEVPEEVAARDLTEETGKKDAGYVVGALMSVMGAVLAIFGIIHNGRPNAHVRTADRRRKSVGLHDAEADLEEGGTVAAAGNVVINVGATPVAVDEKSARQANFTKSSTFDSLADESLPELNFTTESGEKTFESADTVDMDTMADAQAGSETTEDEDFGDPV